MSNKIRKFIRCVVPFVLVFSLLFGSYGIVASAEESYKTVEFNARNNWNDGAGYTEFLATYYLPSDAQMFAFRLGDDETGTAFRDRNLHIVVMDNTVDFDIIDYDCVYSEIMWKYGSVIGENYNSPSIYTMSKTRLLERLYDEASSTSHSPIWGFAQRINEYTFPFPVFDSVAGFIAYLETGDTSGIENYEDIMQGPTLPTPDQSNDDILNGIWGGVVDSEIVYEEDDGTALGAIRTAFKNIVNGLTAPMRTLQQLVKLLPSAVLGILGNSEFGRWVKGIFEYIVGLPVMIIDSLMESEFAEWLWGLFETANAIPLSIMDAFLKSEFFLQIKTISENIVGLPFLVVDSMIQRGQELLVFLFVPSGDFLKTEFSLFVEKTNFIWQIVDLGNDLFEGIISSSVVAPSITIHLGDIIGQRYGTEDVVISFDWYAPYKPFVDLFLSAILWMTFLWNTFIHLPGILSGASGSITGVTTINEEVEREKATDVKKHYWEL